MKFGLMTMTAAMVCAGFGASANDGLGKEGWLTTGRFRMFP